MHTRYKFIRTSDDGSKTINITEAMILTEVIDEFEAFLRGCGFVFDGHLEVVDDKDE